MDTKSIYRDIAARTGGDIYIGVVGPVRTGKSTFIKQFMEKLVLPEIDNPSFSERARDERQQQRENNQSDAQLISAVASIHESAQLFH